LLGFDLLIIVQVKIFRRQEGRFGIPPPSGPRAKNRAGSWKLNTHKIWSWELETDNEPKWELELMSFLYNSN
jgi:hypothetical protein